MHAMNLNLITNASLFAHPNSHREIVSPSSLPRGAQFPLKPLVTFSRQKKHYPANNLTLSMVDSDVDSTNHVPALKEDHLILLVNGIFASPNDWDYVASEFKHAFGNTSFVHASSANSFFQTLEGIDVAGRRLADEVLQIVKEKPELRQLTVVAHSLGGLIARYALGVLYSSESGKSPRIGGLKPVSFITLATPHLGVRGRNQLPFLLGVEVLETVAPFLAPVIVGPTGRQLFLTDGGHPLLEKMTTDNDEAPFLSALACFDQRILYANVGYDHMVGWKTSSIRRENELPTLPKRSISDRHKHVLLCEDSSPFPLPGLGVNSPSERPTESSKSVTWHDQLEEKMLLSLQTLSWHRVDVSFREAYFPLFAHNNIHVKLPWLHFEGKGVINHLVDTIKKSVEIRSLHASL